MAFIPPTKIVFSGNHSACQEHIKFAMNQLAILERQMSFQGLNEGVRRVTPYHGVYVECISRFGHKETRIHVQPSLVVPVDAKKPMGRLKEDLRKCPGYLFYIRIECFGDDNVGIPTDRLILYQMNFHGLPNDTPLENTNNAGNGFTPGEGTVVADVDLIEQTVIYPEGLDVDEASRFIQFAIAKANNIPSIYDPPPTELNPPPGFKNHALDLYSIGPMENIVWAISVAGYSSDLPSVATEIPISGKLEVTGGINWSFFTDPTDDDQFINLAAWRAKWSPSAGGKTTWYTNDDWLAYTGNPEDFEGDGYPWEDLDTIDDYYGMFGIPGLYEFIEIERWTSPPPDYGSGMTWQYNINAQYQILGRNILHSDELLGGFFYTAPAPDGASSFFIARKGIEGGTRKDMYAGGSIDGGVTFDLGLVFDSPLDIIFTYDTLNSVVTPLEEVKVSEFYTALPGSVMCSEFHGRYWETLPSVTAAPMITIPPDYWADLEVREKMCSYYGQSVESMMVSHSASYGAGSRVVINTSGVTDSSETTSMFILDRPEPGGLSCQTRFCSLFYLNQQVSAGGSSFGDGSQAWCNGTILAGSYEPTYTNYVGCFIYIFAPKVIFGKDETGKAVYWDIHTARVTNNVINPFRCLDLEEYIMTVVDNIQTTLNSKTDLNNYPEITKLRLSPPVAYGLDHYGYTFRSGFC